MGITRKKGGHGLPTHPLKPSGREPSDNLMFILLLELYIKVRTVAKAIFDLTFNA
jgi:hypothetical protein